MSGEPRLGNLLTIRQKKIFVQKAVAEAETERLRQGKRPLTKTQRRSVRNKAICMLRTTYTSFEYPEKSEEQILRERQDEALSIKRRRLSKAEKMAKKRKEAKEMEEKTKEVQTCRELVENTQLQLEKEHRKAEEKKRSRRGVSERVRRWLRSTNKRQRQIAAWQERYDEAITVLTEIEVGGEVDDDGDADTQKAMRKRRRKNAGQRHRYHAVRLATVVSDVIGDGRPLVQELCYNDGGESDEPIAGFLDVLSDVPRRIARRAAAELSSCSDARYRISGRQIARHATAELETSARHFGLHRVLNGTVAGWRQSVQTALEFNRVRASDFANGVTELVIIFSWDARPVAKTSVSSFPVSSLSARLLVVRPPPGIENGVGVPWDILNYGYTDQPGALAVFARVATDDKESNYKKNCADLERLIGDYLDAEEAGKKLDIEVELNGVQACIPLKKMLRCFDVKAARTFSRADAAKHCVFGCGWQPGVGVHEEYLRHINLHAATRGETNLSRLPPLCDNLHFIKNVGADTIGIVGFRFNQHVSSLGTKQKKKYVDAVTSAADVLREWKVHDNWTLAQQHGGRNRVVLTAANADTFERLFQYSSDNMDATPKERYVVSLFASALWRNFGEKLEDAAVRYVNSIAAIWQSMRYPVHALEDACELAKLPRDVSWPRRARKKDVTRFELLQREHIAAAKAFGIENVENSFTYMHVMRCHLVALRHYMLTEGGVDLQAAHQGAAEALHRVDNRLQTKSPFSMRSMLPRGANNAANVDEVMKKSGRAITEEVRKAGMSMAGKKKEKAQRLVASQQHERKRLADLEKGTIDGEHEKKARMHDPTFRLFELAGARQLRELR